MPKKMLFERDFKLIDAVDHKFTFSSWRVYRQKNHKNSNKTHDII